MPLEDISINLINICDSIIKTTQINENPAEYNKNGRKYKKTAEGNFIRLRNENRHLIVSKDYLNYNKNYSIISSYYILKSFGNVLIDYKDFCLSIILTSREIELNKWYESNSKICSIEDATYDPFEDSTVETEALNYIANICVNDKIKYIKKGCEILSATKINFIQSDHHVSSPKLEGYVLKKLIVEICNDDSNSLTSVDVFNSLRAFSHWSSIRGILYSLDIPGLKVSNEITHNFRTFPKQSKWIKDSVLLRYPAGTSKLSLIKKSLMIISESVYGKLITSPNPTTIKELFAICYQIESDPLRYHIRSSSSNLSINPPVNIDDVFQKSNELIEFISVVFHSSNSHFLNSTIFSSSKLIRSNRLKPSELSKHILKINKQLVRCKSKPESDIVELMGGQVPNSLSLTVANCL